MQHFLDIRDMNRRQSRERFAGFCLRLVVAIVCGSFWAILAHLFSPVAFGIIVAGLTWALITLMSHL